MEHDERYVDVSDEQREQRLIDRARQGDAQAFGQIYQRHVDRVYSFVLFRVRDTELAEDLTQEVFIQALRALGAFDWRGAFAPWLLRIARNAVIDHWRKVARRPERAMSLVEVGEGDEDGAGIDRLAGAEADLKATWVDATLDRERISRAARQLTELQQEVLALRFAAGMTIRETAGAMGRTEGAIKNLQHHALRTLRRLLEPGEALS